MKVPFQQVYLVVDKMYQVELTDEDAIDKHCENIVNYIENCGWDINDFIHEMMFGNRNLNEKAFKIN